MKWIFLAGLVPALLVFRYAPSSSSPWYLTVGLTVVAVASFGLIGMTLRPGSAAYRIFHLRPARVLGRYSYGFYVWHVVWAKAWIAVLIFVTARTHSTALGGIITLPIAFAVTFLAAKLSYDLFEVRFLRLKRRFENDSELATHRTAFAPDAN